MISHNRWLSTAALMLVAGFGSVQRAEPRVANTAETMKVQRVFHIAGVPGVKRNGRGDLVFSAKNLVFVTHHREALIVPYQRIRRVTVVDSSREYAKAAYAAVVTFGVAGVLLLQEHHVDGLVIDFDNERGGHMLAVFQLPKNNGARCEEWLTHAGVQSGPATFETNGTRTLSQVTK